MADAQIFYHLVFYIDTPENAEKTGLATSDPSQAVLDRRVNLFPPRTKADPAGRLSEAERLLKDNGGRVVSDIHDPKLTHIIMDDDDSGRYAELSRKTYKCVHHPEPHARSTDPHVQAKAEAHSLAVLGARMHRRRNAHERRWSV